MRLFVLCTSNLMRLTIRRHIKWNS